LLGGRYGIGGRKSGTLTSFVFNNIWSVDLLQAIARTYKVAAATSSSQKRPMRICLQDGAERRDDMQNNWNLLQRGAGGSSGIARRTIDNIGSMVIFALKAGLMEAYSMVSPLVKSNTGEPSIGFLMCVENMAKAAESYARKPRKVATKYIVKSD
jgi:hypothetical protein